MTDCRQLLAKNIKKYRKIMGISQMALAEKIGCSTTLIGNIEINRRFPSPNNINRITKALNVKVADLFAEVDNTEATAQYADRQKQKAKLEKYVMKAISKAFSESEE